MPELMNIPAYISLILWVGLLALKGFAVIDAAIRPQAAFPAADKQTKILWLILTGLALLTHFMSFSPISLFGIAGTVAAAVYVVGVRPAVKEASGRGGNREGPYGPW